ncbi:MAG TPA: hypothetical protein VNL16_11335 [Chloroflexota bacterium]|nr:hypothetical protein [Chloroflexota bacterium]
MATYVTQIAQVYGNGWLVPHDPPDAPKRTPQPLKPLLEAVSVKNPRASDIPRTYIYCTDKAAETTDNPVWAAVMGIITQTAAQARGAGWRYRELKTGHSPWETAPRELADVLLEITRAVSRVEETPLSHESEVGELNRVRTLVRGEFRW